MQALDSPESVAPSSPAPQRRDRVRALSFWAAALIVVGLDQATKAIIRASLDRGESWPADTDLPIRIRYVTNTGAAFGILEGQIPFLVAMTVLGLVAIYLYYRNPPFHHWVGSVAIGLMLGGAVGNMIDRVRLGRVTDFVDPDRFPAFNVADASINVGVAVLLLGYLVYAERQVAHPHVEPEQAHEDPPADG